MNNRFPKRFRLRKNWEYDEVKKMGCKLNTPHFILLYKKNDHENSRLGVIASRKVGNSVQRNIVKRKVREFFRKSKIKLSFYDIIVIAKKKSFLQDSSIINEELSKLDNFLKK